VGVLLAFAGRTLGDIELVEDMERLKNGIVASLRGQDRLAEGDGAAIIGEPALDMTAKVDGTELLVFDLP